MRGGGRRVVLGIWEEGNGTREGEVGPGRGEGVLLRIGEWGQGGRRGRTERGEKLVYVNLRFFAN